MGERISLRRTAERSPTLLGWGGTTGPARYLKRSQPPAEWSAPRVTEAQLSAALDGAAIGVAVVTPRGRIAYSNRALQQMLGYSAEEVSRLTIASLVHPDDVDLDLDPYHQLAGGEGDHGRIEKRFRRKDGQFTWCHVTAALVQGEGGTMPELVVTLEDTTENRWMAEALRESERQLREVVEQARDGIFIGTPDGLVIKYNRAMEVVSGYTMVEANEHGWFNLAFRDPGTRTAIAEMAARAVCGDSGTAEAPIVRKNGEGGWVAISMAPISVGGQRFALGIVTDITRSKQQEERLTHLATHDVLTGLPNRLVLEEHVRRELARARVRGPRSALLFADLDHLKLVNDSLGHSAGDEVLCTLAELLKRNLRGEDLVARLGGDEFAILLLDTDAQGARAVAEQLRQAVDDYSFNLRGRTFHLGLSVGVTPIHGQRDAGAVLSQADAAMYRAKAQGRNRVAVHLAQENEDVTNDGLPRRTRSREATLL